VNVEAVPDLNVLRHAAQACPKATFDSPNAAMRALLALRHHGSAAGFTLHVGPELFGRYGDERGGRQRPFGLRHQLAGQGWDRVDVERFVEFVQAVAHATGGRSDVATDAITSKAILRLQLAYSVPDDEDAVVFQMARNAGASVIITDDRFFRLDVGNELERRRRRGEHEPLLEFFTLAEALDEVASSVRRLSRVAAV